MMILFMGLGVSLYVQKHYDVTFYKTSVTHHYIHLRPLSRSSRSVCQVHLYSSSSS